jgi:hypothetical protein
MTAMQDMEENQADKKSLIRELKIKISKLFNDSKDKDILIEMLKSEIYGLSLG